MENPRALFTLMMLAAMAVCCIIIVLLMPHPARAHSWYPFECCSDKDCARVPAASVKREPAGWRTPRGHLIPFDDKRLKPLPIGVTGVHLCERTDGTPICLFIGEEQI